MLASAAIEALNIMEQKPGNSEIMVILHCNPLVSKNKWAKYMRICYTALWELLSYLIHLHCLYEISSVALYFKFLDMFDDLREKAKLLHAELDG